MILILVPVMLAVAEHLASLGGQFPALLDLALLFAAAAWALMVITLTAAAMS